MTKCTNVFCEHYQEIKNIGGFCGLQSPIIGKGAKCIDYKRIEIERGKEG